MKIKYLQRFTRVSLSYSGKATPESASATHVVTPRLCSISLRVECLLKTDCGYPKDTGVTLYTLTTPRNPFRYNTPQSALPVSTLAHSRGPRKRSQSSVHMLEHRGTGTYGQAQVCSGSHQGSSRSRGKLMVFCPSSSSPSPSFSFSSHFSTGSIRFFWKIKYFLRKSVLTLAD